MRPTRADWRVRAALAVTLATLVVAGCGSGASDKAGGKNRPEPTVLTFANSNGDSASLAPFAAAVARLSGRTLRVEFKDSWREGNPDYEAGLIRDVRDGKADLGWAGSRAFDDVDVSSFDALHAPLLIDSYPYERKVLESSLVAPMLAGLEPLGLVGLGILPGPLRKPLGTSELVRPADYQGMTVAFTRSQVAEQTLRALGARGARLPAGAPVDGYDGVEQQVSSIAGNGYDKVGNFLTANVNLWPRPAVVFMNPKAFDRLSGRQRSALRGAARAALSATLALEQTGDEEGSATLCRRGVTFVTASDADLVTLRRAVQPVYDRLERDARTKAAIARIRSLRSDAASPPDAPVCAGSPSQPPASDAASPIDGVYRSNITRDELIHAPGYVSGEDQPGNVGRFRMELREGRFRISGSSDAVDQDGAYSVNGDVLSFDWNGEGSFAYRWNLYRGALTLKRLGDGPTFFTVHPWRSLRASSKVGKRTPIDGVYLLNTTRKESARASGEPVQELLSENYGKWRFVLSRGQMRYTQSSEGASRWTKASYSVKGQIFTYKVTDYGGEAPNGAADKTGEEFTFTWSLYRDRLSLGPVKGKISPEGFRFKAWRRVADAP